MDFSFSPALIIMNIAYVLNLIGLAVKNILILRLLLIFAQIILIYTGYVRGNWIVMFWNAIFLVINMFRAILLLLERRPVKLPSELNDLYKDNFYHMTDREFLRFWSIGKKQIVENGYIIKKGETTDSVYMILKGRALVENNSVTVAVLRRGGFIGEMSYVSDLLPSANVKTESNLELWKWKKTELSRLKVKDHTLWVKMQQVLGHDLVLKVSRMSLQKPKENSGLLSKAARLAGGHNFN